MEKTPMKALSWKQPYADLMFHGKIETRTWYTHYRGWVLICASKQPYKTDKILKISGEIQTGRILETLSSTQTHLTGKAIAIGYLIDCRQMSQTDDDACYVQYRRGLYCHVYRNVTAIEPIEWKGAQGWKNVSDEIIKLIKPLSGPQINYAQRL